MGAKLVVGRRRALWKIIERRQKQQAKHKNRRTWLMAIAVSLVLLSSSAGSLLTVQAYQAYNALYHRDMVVAQDAIQRLHTAGSLLTGLAKNPFDAPALARAGQEFAASRADFTLLNASLHTLPPISMSLPVYGRRIAATFHLVVLASDVSRAGEIGCTLLQTLLAAFHNPLQARGGGLTPASLSLITNDARQIEAEINDAVGAAGQVSPSDVQFDAHLASLLATFQGDVPLIQGWITDINAFLKVAPTVLGVSAPANLLIEVLDSTELRPGGGFIGNYGIATIADGRLASAHITDVDLLDQPFEYNNLHMIPYPPQFTWFKGFLSHHTWSLRDSNLSADFPTSARYGEANYRLEGGSVPVQGVIAITPFFIEHILQITGPIAVPEYQEVITAQNLIDRIHYYQLGAGRQGQSLDYIPSPDGHSSQRKRFTELLSEYLFARVHQLPPASLSRLLALLVSSLRTKDIQVYFNQPAAEKLLQNVHLDAAIEAPAGDSIFVVNANVSGSKANRYITTTLKDTVTLDAQGDALHRATLRYAWLTPGDVYGNQVYTGYIHIYVPPGSTLFAVSGWSSRGTSMAFGREAWAGFIKLTFGHVDTISLTWMVHGAVQRGASGCRYQELIQRQAGLLANVAQRVILPPSAAFQTIQGGLVQNGAATAALNEPITEDITAAINYTC